MTSTNSKAISKRERIRDRILDILDNDEMLGICLACENEQSAEPDASNYECEECGKHQVYGAEMLLFMLS